MLKMMSPLLPLMLLLSLSKIVSANDLNLPDLGGAGGGLISAAQEYELGQQWQRVFRSQMRTSNDPFLQSYTEKIIRGLAKHSDLTDKRLDILVVENPTLNAFAVPGGIIGVHTGLFQYAKTEQQFASVMAHELAHLSQRHFARKLDEQRNNSIPNLAALLASILVLATSGGDAGIAALSTAQAIAIDKQLRFSREMEQEADRLAMETMVRAGMSPNAMPNMFREMLHASRFQRRPPEFLITHPLTESRVSDAKLRAQQHPNIQEQFSLAYALTRTRADIAHSVRSPATVKRYREKLAQNRGNRDVARYGYVLALMKTNKHAEAQDDIDILLQQDSNNLFYVVTKAEIEAATGDLTGAISRLQKQLADYPNDHALNIKLAEILMLAGQYEKCKSLLEKHSIRRPKDDYIWYLLAEAYGLNGEILAVHEARAEYFLLNGLYRKSESHLRHALRLSKGKTTKRAQLEEKLKKIQRMRRDEIL